MKPREVEERVGNFLKCPRASLQGWKIITEPATQYAEIWTVYADLHQGADHEDRTIYLRSDSSGEIISALLPALAGCELLDPTDMRLVWRARRSPERR